MWTDFERAQIDAALKSEQIGPVLDFWEAMVRAGGMPPMSPDHVRVVLMAFRRERGDPVQVRSEQYVGADGEPHNIVKLTK